MAEAYTIIRQIGSNVEFFPRHLRPLLDPVYLARLWLQIFDQLDLPLQFLRLLPQLSSLFFQYLLLFLLALRMFPHLTNTSLPLCSGLLTFPLETLRLHSLRLLP